MKKQGYDDKEEIELLRNICDPEGYRRRLAEKLLQRGRAIVDRERRQINPYKMRLDVQVIAPSTVEKLETEAA